MRPQQKMGRDGNLKFCNRPDNLDKNILVKFHIDSFNSFRVIQGRKIGPQKFRIFKKSLKIKNSKK